MITKFHCAIKYTPENSFQQFADEVSDARRAEDIDKAYELIAETMKLFGNSAGNHHVTPYAWNTYHIYLHQVSIWGNVMTPKIS